jgi:maltooligosyltrehalose trehalohydrolase
VCLDVVYNHLGPDGNYLGEIGPYFTDTHPTPWGQALNLDGPDSDEVRRWVLDNVQLWLRDFHVDGLRLDAVHELHDESALHLLEEMSREVDALAADTGRELWLVAESDRNDPRTVTPRGSGDAVAGLGLHGQWADDVHHALHVALTGETQGYYADFAAPEALPKTLRSPFFHDGTRSTFRGRRHGRPVDTATVPGWRFVASLQTHDQVGNRAQGDRLSMLVDDGLLACGAAILLTSPWTPMLFMGEEWGARTPWQFFTDHTNPEIAEATARGRKAEFGSHGWDERDVPDPQDPETFRRSRLDWSEPTEEPHARLLAWYRDLIALRRAEPDLHDPRLDRVEVTWSDRRLDTTRGSFRVLVNLADDTWSCEADGEVVLAWEPGVRVVAGSVDVPARSAVLLRTSG